MVMASRSFSLSRSRSFSRSRSLSFSDPPDPDPPPRLESVGDVGPPAADPVIDEARPAPPAAAADGGTEDAGVDCFSEVVGTGGRGSSRSMAAAARAEAGLVETTGSPVAIVVSSSATTNRATDTSLRRVPSLFFGGIVDLVVLGSFGGGNSRWSISRCVFFVMLVVVGFRSGTSYDWKGKVC